MDGLMGEVKAFNVQENETLVVLIGEHTDIDLVELVGRLNLQNIQFIGGLFTGIIDGSETHQKGIILKKISTSQAPIVVEGLEGTDFVIPQILLPKMVGKPTILTLVDGLTANIGSYLEQLYQQIGTDAKFLGAGAGSLSLKQSPCVFSNAGVFQDAAVLCVLDVNAGLGIQHGWTKLLGPFITTKTQKNVICELNWTNAFSVYKDAVDKDANTSLSRENFFEIAKAYPFGIIKDNGEDIIRDPIAVGDNGSLICVGEVPENTVLYIMKGEPASLVASANVAMAECLDDTSGKPSDTLVVDCVSRTLFLQKDFGKELNAIVGSLENNGLDLRPEGVLSLGEISSSGKGLLEFYNKTLVIGAFYSG